MRREGVQGKEAANQTHYDVGAKVRQTIKEIGGRMPEDYPAAEHIKEPRKRMKAEERGAPRIGRPGHGSGKV